MVIKGLPTIYDSSKLLDISFSRGSKEAKKVSAKDARTRLKRREIAKVKVSSEYITGYLSKLEKVQIKVEELSTFYRELIDISASDKKIEEAFSRVRWARKRISQLQNDALRNIRMSKGDPRTLRRAFYGRAASFLEGIDAELVVLGELFRLIKGLPTIDEGYNVVIAGMPNVGKSSLLQKLTGSTPEVKTYPFTTKRILVGHITIDHKRVGIIDTPGLLDRRMEDRNPIEKQAILALKHLADVILFLFDPSETSGFTQDSQIELYRELSGGFENLVPVANKVDLASEDSLRRLGKKIGKKPLRCSALLGETDEVAGFILQQLEKERRQDLPPANSSPI